VAPEARTLDAQRSGDPCHTACLTREGARAGDDEKIQHRRQSLKAVD